MLSHPIELEISNMYNFRMRVVSRQHSSPGSVIPERGQSSRSRSQGQKFCHRMKGLFMKHLYVKYQNPIPHGSKDTAQFKVFPLRCDANTGVITIALRTLVLAN